MRSAQDHRRRNVDWGEVSGEFLKKLDLWRSMQPAHRRRNREVGQGGQVFRRKGRVKSHVRECTCPRARACARARRAGTISIFRQPSPCSPAYWSQNSGRSAKRLACRARVLLAKIPIALKRAVGLSGSSQLAASAHPAAMVGTDIPKLRGRTGNEAIAVPTAPSRFRCRPADPWKLGANSRLLPLAHLS
jgi:hypothetical protein